RTRASAARRERLDLLRVANERDHDGEPAQEEDALHDVHAVGAEIEKVGDRPAAGEGGTKHLGADQDGGADPGHHVLPGNPAVAAEGRSVVHHIGPTIAFSGEVDFRFAAENVSKRNKSSGRNLSEMPGRIKVSGRLPTPAGTARTAPRPCA